MAVAVADARLRWGSLALDPGLWWALPPRLTISRHFFAFEGGDLEVALSPQELEKFLHVEHLNGGGSAEDDGVVEDNGVVRVYRRWRGRGI